LYLSKLSSWPVIGRALCASNGWHEAKHEGKQSRLSRCAEPKPQFAIVDRASGAPTISMMRQLLLPLRRAQTHLREPKLTHFSSDPGIAALNLFRVFGSRFPVRSVRACSMNLGAQDGIAVLRATGRHEEAQDRLGPRFTEMKLAVRRRPCPVPANEATVTEVPEGWRLWDGLPLALDQRAAIDVAATVQGIPVVRDGRGGTE
jgi:hypothetical protein